MKQTLLTALLLFVLIFTFNCEKQDSGVDAPDKNPTFNIKIKVYNFNEPTQGIADADIEVRLTETKDVYTTVTDESGIFVTPEITPQYVYITVAHSDYHSPFNDTRTYVTYADSVLNSPMVGYIAPEYEVDLSDSLSVSAPTALAWGDGHWWMGGDVGSHYGMHDPSKIMRFDTEFQTEYPDSVWGNPTYASQLTPYLEPQSFMWDTEKDQLWTNYGNQYFTSEKNSRLFLHDDRNLNYLDYQFLFHYYISGYKYADDLSWYDGEYFWGCNGPYIFRTYLDIEAEILTENVSYLMSGIGNITGIEYDRANQLWGCTDENIIFRAEITESNTVSSINKKYHVKNYILYDMTTDGNGNYWVLARPEADPYNPVVLKFILES